MSCALNEPRVSRGCPGEALSFPAASIGDSRPSIKLEGRAKLCPGGCEPLLLLALLFLCPKPPQAGGSSGNAEFPPELPLCSVGLPQCCTVENFPVPRLNPSLFHFRIKQALSWPRLLLLDQQMWLSTSWKSLPEPSDTPQAPKELFRHPSANLLPL